MIGFGEPSLSCVLNSELLRFVVLNLVEKSRNLWCSWSSWCVLFEFLCRGLNGILVKQERA